MMGTPPLLLSTLLLTTACAGVAVASTRRTAVDNEFFTLGRILTLYHNQKGEYPVSWEDFSKVRQIDTDSTFSMIIPTRRVVLLSPPVQLTGRYAGSVAIAITRDTYRPQHWGNFNNQRSLGEPVYGVYVPGEDRMEFRRIPPLVVSSIFKEQGREMPAPSGMPPFAYETQTIQNIFLKWLALAVGGFWLVWRLIRRGRDRRDSYS